MAVLDASAILAYLLDEEGADLVGNALAEGAAISSVNWAESLSKLADEGEAPGRVAARLGEQGLLGPALDVVPFTAEDAVLVAALRSRTKELALSLGDRACLALGARLGVTVLTADRTWTEADAGVEVSAIR